MNYKRSCYQPNVYSLYIMNDELFDRLDTANLSERKKRNKYYTLSFHWTNDLLKLE